MKTETLGTLRRDGERRAVRYERHYTATPEEVWAALTEPAQVRNWFAEMKIEPRAGGQVTFEWSGGEREAGVVRVFDPPTTFEYTWENGSIIRFDLAPDGDGTLLVLDHSKLPPDQTTGVGAGWHAHLDAIEALLAGSPQTAPEWKARYESLRPEYEERATQL
jgi:uncharacterized protein YndB with AHSA1/START domain